MDGEPISNVRWVSRDTLKANDYNPNRVAPDELDLLMISILEDGWTQPIVITEQNEIIDGFHRWSISDRTAMRNRYDGMVPVVTAKPKDIASQKMATIRHNRARGTHGVLDMSNIVQSLIEGGMCKEEIMLRLKMEEEEVIRLAMRQGIPMTDIISNRDFSQAWEV